VAIVAATNIVAASQLCEGQPLALLSLQREAEALCWASSSLCKASTVSGMLDMHAVRPNMLAQISSLTAVQQP